LRPGGRRGWLTMDLPDTTLGMKLPVSGMDVVFRSPDGNDDLTILEASGGAVERALAVLPRLARLGGNGGGSRWAGLTVTDFEAAQPRCWDCAGFSSATGSLACIAAQTPCVGGRWSRSSRSRRFSKK
jgi:hypothetical protein